MKVSGSLSALLWRAAKDVVPEWEHTRPFPIGSVLEHHSSLLYSTPYSFLRYSQVADSMQVLLHAASSCSYYLVYSPGDLTSVDVCAVVEIPLALPEALEHYTRFMDSLGVEDTAEHREVQEVRHFYGVVERWEGDVCKYPVREHAGDATGCIWYGPPLECTAYPSAVPFLGTRSGLVFLGVGGVPFGRFVQELSRADSGVRALYSNILRCKDSLSPGDYVRCVLNLFHRALEEIHTQRGEVP